jgi:hypothetical protein
MLVYRAPESRVLPHDIPGDLRLEPLVEAGRAFAQGQAMENAVERFLRDGPVLGAENPEDSEYDERDEANHSNQDITS